MMELAARGRSGYRQARRRSVARRCVLAACSAILMLLPSGAAGSAGAGALPAGFSHQEVAGARLLFKAPATPGQGSIFAVMFAGSGDKEPDETHCAHAAEHMVFRNPLRDGRSLGQAVTEWGGIYNGWTGTHHTQFEISVPDERLPEALQKLAEALFPASLDEGALREEIRQRLARELKHMTTNELSAPLNAFRQQLFRGTPYEERLFEVPVTDLTAARVASFMAREYSPQRLVIVVVASIEEAALAEALADALARVPPGDPPARRQVSLSPPPSANLALRGLGTPLIMVGLGVDGIEEDEHGALLAVAFSLVLPQVLAAAPQGLESDPRMCGDLPLEGARCLMVTFAVTGGLPAAKLERLAQEAVEAVRSAVNAFTADGPDESVFLGLLEASGEPPEPEQLPPGIPPSLIEAWLAGIAQVPGFHTQPPSLLTEVEPGEAAALIAAVSRRYLPGATYTVLVVTGTSNLVPALVTGAAALVIVAAVLGLVQARRKRRRSPDAGS